MSFISIGRERISAKGESKQDHHSDFSSETKAHCEKKVMQFRAGDDDKNLMSVMLMMENGHRDPT